MLTHDVVCVYIPLRTEIVKLNISIFCEKNFRVFETLIQNEDLGLSSLGACHQQRLQHGPLFWKLRYRLWLPERWPQPSLCRLRLTEGRTQRSEAEHVRQRPIPINGFWFETRWLEPSIRPIQLQLPKQRILQNGDGPHARLPKERICTTATTAANEIHAKTAKHADEINATTELKNIHAAH